MTKDFIDLQHDKYGVKAIFHAVMGILIFVAGNLLASLPVDLFYMITEVEYSPITAIIRPLLTLVVLWLLFRLYIGKVLKMRIQDFRVSKPKNIILWSVCAFVLPLSVSAFFVFMTPGHFTVSGFDTVTNIDIILKAVFSLCLTAGITEEIIFRGFLMRLLEQRWGKVVAVVAPSVLFGALHIMNMESPNAVDIIILLVAGSAVGIMFSMIAIQSDSIWTSAIVHGVWNLIIIGGILGIGAGEPRVIFNYRLTSESTLMTGGLYGIEASLPAIIGYVVVIFIAYGLTRSSNRK